MSDPLSYSYSLTRTKMLPPPTPVVRKRSLLQRASSKLSSANRRSFGRWRSASLADLSNTSNNSKSSTTNDPFLVPNLSRCSSTEFRRPSLPTNEPQNLASIKRKSLRSSWRDLASEVSYDGDSLSNGGVNRGGHRFSHVLKPVTPPVVPGQERRANGINFPNRVSGSELRMRSDPSFRQLQEEGSSEMPLSPGRDSIGHDSTASGLTTESTSSGCRTSITSTDSGRQKSHLHRSLHSSSSSIVSGERGEDVICPVSVRALMESGLPDAEVLNAWLTDLNFDKYCQRFITAGYDMHTISRMTPEDLTAIGIQKPAHRKTLKSEISKLDIGDGLPNFIPRSLEEWLYLIRLSEYTQSLLMQGYSTIEDVIQISVEDLEDVGILKLGHQKRFLLAVKKVKDLKSGKLLPQNSASDLYSTFGSGTPTRRITPQPQQQQFQHAPSTFKASHLPMSPNNNNSNANVHQQHPNNPMQQRLYQPEVIPILNHTISSSSAFPPPPASPSSARLHSVPAPMAPFEGLNRSRYNPRTFNPNFVQQQGSPVRSFDDSHFVRRPSMQPPPLKSDMVAVSGGGTLPRPRGLVKPMPIAKAASMNNSEGDLNLKLDVSDFKKEFLPTGEKMDMSNDVQCVAPIKPDHHGSKATSPAKDGKRSPGDVLNDIGSMLADLTDELDAMLHSERDSNVCQ